MEHNSSISTWGSSQVLLSKDCLPPIDLSNNSLHQIFKISVGGEKFRIKISNKYGNDSLEIKSISIATIKSKETDEIELNTIKKITFCNNDSISISKGEEVYTDIIDYHLPSFSEVTITIFFGKVPSDKTGHKFSITNSFIELGNKINEAKFSTKNKIEHWYFISNIDLITKKEIKGLICYGDSITDGRFSTIDKHERWPDYLFKKLKKQHINMAINNQGLSGSFLSKEGIERFENDVLKQNGAKYLIVLYGINDIAKLNLDEKLIIDSFKKLIKMAHKENMLVYGGTLTPFKGYRLYSEEKNDVRNKVNEWIRSCKKIKDGFDEYIDFDLIIRDSNDITQIKGEYNSGDGVHFNSLGYEKMVEAFNDLSFFNN